MRISTVFFWLALAAVLPPSSAAAQGLPACPSDGGDDALRTIAPTFSRLGQSDRFRVEPARSDAGESVTNVVLTLTPEPGDPTTTAVLLDAAGEARVIFRVPPAGGQYTANLEWDQDVRTQAACHGSDVHRIPLVSGDGKAGDPAGIRLSGTFTARYKNAPTGSRLIWRISAKCAFFACSATLMSEAGLSGTFTRKGRNYQLVKNYPAAGWCEYTRVTSDPTSGAVLERRRIRVQRAYTTRRTLSLRVTERDAAGVKTFVVFQQSVNTLVPRARKGCRKGTTTLDRITGTRTSLATR